MVAVTTTQTRACRAPDINSAPAVTLVIPAHNEAQRLAATIDLYHRALASAYETDFEVVVVANGCTDSTVSVAAELSRVYAGVRLIEIADAIGKGGAVLAGLQSAAGHAVIFADADGATAPESILNLLEQLAHYDMVIGSRRLRASKIVSHQPLSRRIFGQAFHRTVRLLFGMPYQDTQCGAKAMRLHVARAVGSTVSERQWTFDVDLLLNAELHGFTVLECPIVWSDKAGSRLRLTRASRPVLISLARLWWRHRVSRPSHTRHSGRHLTAQTPSNLQRAAQRSLPQWSADLLPHPVEANHLLQQPLPAPFASER